MKPKDRIIFALDVPDIISAQQFITTLGGEGLPTEGHVGAFKVGLELFMAVGLPVLRIIKQPVMLDLKLHDIPETVERAVQRAADLGVSFLTLHVQQRETMRRAVKAAEKGHLQLLGVTVLTSMSDTDIKDFCRENDTLNAVMSRAKLAHEEGITGFVTSPREVGLLRKAYPDAILVTPGIRPAGTEAGDQKRTGTPSQAIQDGANFIVVGRPIRDSEDPVGAAGAIAEEIATVI